MSFGFVVNLLKPPGHTEAQLYPETDAHMAPQLTHEPPDTDCCDGGHGVHLIAPEVELSLAGHEIHAPPEVEN